MEGHVARRRINTIASHFVTHEDMSAQQLLPMNCSGSLDTVARRCDNRMFFARQAGSQTCFMRPGSIEQNCSGNLDTVARRCDNRMFFARQAGLQTRFMRPGCIDQDGLIQCGNPPTCTGLGGACNATSEPLFSKPAQMEQKASKVGLIQPLGQGFNLTTVPEPPPCFARPNKGMAGQQNFNSKKKEHASKSYGAGIEWSPRMDVAESERSYVLIVEIPGVSPKDIRVEVSSQKVTVMGTRSTQSLEVAGYPNGSTSLYHKREIIQGPYQAVWPLPSNVNKDRVSADFMDGFLQIVVPKL